MLKESFEKMEWWVTYRHIISIDVVGSFVIVHRLQFEARMIVWQNIGKSILRTIAWQVGKGAWLIAAHVLQLLELFAKSVFYFFFLQERQNICYELEICIYRVCFFFVCVLT